MKAERIEVRLNQTDKERFDYLKAKLNCNNTELFRKMLSNIFTQYEQNGIQRIIEKPIGINHTNSNDDQLQEKINALVVMNLLALKKQYPSLMIEKMILDIDPILREEIFKQVSKIEYQ